MKIKHLPKEYSFALATVAIIVICIHVQINNMLTAYFSEF